MGDKYKLGYITADKTFSLPSYIIGNRPVCLRFDPSGNNMFILGQYINRIFKFNLGTSYDITTSTLDCSLNVSNSLDGSANTEPWSYEFDTSGSNLYVLYNGTSDKRIIQYDLSANYDISNSNSLSKSGVYDMSASYDPVDPKSFTIFDNGENMFVADISNIYQYTLTTPHDITTASFEKVSGTIFTNDIPNDLGWTPTSDIIESQDKKALYFLSEFNKEIKIVDSGLSGGVTGYSAFDVMHTKDLGDTYRTSFAWNQDTWTNNPLTDSFSLGNISVFKQLLIQPRPSTNICFPAGTPVLTDQGKIAIEKLNSSYTIRGKEIVGISQTINTDDCLVSIKKGSLYKHIPSQDTLISANHSIMYQGKMIPARKMLGKVNGVSKVPYNGEILYNVLMKKHDKMVINRMIVETLNPENVLARLYNGSMNETQKQEYIKAYNAYHKENKTFEANKLKR